MADDSSSDSTSWKGSKMASGLRAAGKSMQQSGQSQIEAARDQAARGAVPSYKKGGRVKKTGLARVHKGEQVIPAHKAHKGRSGKKARKAGRS
jgi:hypothetical protein